MSTSNNQLNENHGIAATGIQHPHTAIPPTTYNDKAGSNNPSHTNRHAGTCVPPVNTAQHVEHNIHHENQPKLDKSSAYVDKSASPSTNDNAVNNSTRHTATPQHENLGEDSGDQHQETEAVTGQHPITSDGVDNTKPSAGDKIKGNVEKLAGKITGNEAKVIKGENIAHGRA